MLTLAVGNRAGFRPCRASAAEEEMEKSDKSNKCRKRKMSKYETPSVMNNTETIFALILATLCNHGNGPNSQSFLKTCINQLYASLFSKSLNSIPLYILSLFPILLSSK